MPEISVVMPAYNQERYVREAVDSILAQTWRDFEFVIVDDGSTDATARIIRAIGDRRIRLIDASHSGFLGALERGVREARGRWVARMDADDVSHPRRFEEQMRELARRPGCSFVTCNHGVLTPNGKFLAPRAAFDWHDLEVRHLTTCEYPFTDAGVIFDRAQALAAGLYDRDFENEKPLYYRMLAAGCRAGVIGRALYFARYFPGSHSRTAFDARAAAYLEIRRRYDAEGYRIAAAAAAKATRRPELAHAQIAVVYSTLAGDRRGAWDIALRTWRRFPVNFLAAKILLKAGLGAWSLRPWGPRDHPNYYAVEQPW